MDNTVHMPNIRVKKKVRILFGSIELSECPESAGRSGVAESLGVTKRPLKMRWLERR
jgi:hypothetical protein